MIRKAEKPESARPREGTTAAKAVRTDTKLSYGVTERYGRVLAGYGQQEQGKSTYPGGDPAFRVTTGATQPVTRLYGPGARPAFRRTSSAGPSKNSVQASAAPAGSPGGLPNK